MKKLIVFVLCLVSYAVFVECGSQKSISQTVWSEQCNRHQRILNDCNWCKCGANLRFVCSARHCSTIDKFGHFNDAIQVIDVGMEGHGVWRSKEEICQPGNQYQRGSLLCVCNEQGNWPNPVCRDTFRVMHPIQVLSDNAKSCEPSTLYLSDCNACLCPPDGSLTNNTCTKKDCDKNDPVLRKTEEVEDNEIDEIYATCTIDMQYKLGCKSCICLRNNRLLCDQCEGEKKEDKGNFYCSNTRPHEIFKQKCNLCFCDEANVMYCSVKRCLSENNEFTDLLAGVNTNLRSADPPLDDKDCVPGTIYQKDCNTCQCIETRGKKILACTLKGCMHSARSKVDALIEDCVVGTTYHSDCHECACEAHDGEKRQVCIIKPECSTPPSRYKHRSSNDLNYKSGYCEPMHFYNDGCNVCQCLSNGKSVQCTSNICRKKSSSGAIDVDLVPIVDSGSKCPKGHSYKVDCNVCFCLSNGNAICTMSPCNKK